MTSVQDKTDKLVEYIDEAKKLGIAVLPPDINESLIDFAVVGDRIRFGLAAVKGVGEGAVAASSRRANPTGSSPISSTLPHNAYFAGQRRRRTSAHQRNQGRCNVVRCLCHRLVAATATTAFASPKARNTERAADRLSAS